MLHKSTYSGRRLSLAVFGASHASRLGMELTGFPAGFEIDLPRLQAFMERRAPGRDALSTSRREPDAVVFTAGVTEGRTLGERIVAEIANTNLRPGDYGNARSVPRPGHADFPMWVKTGAMPTGGGAHSGRMTAAMCIAGGLCLQWLERRGIFVNARVVEIGGSEDFEQSILKAKNEGDSVGGIIELCVEGVPAGLGGAMFDGLESRLAAALCSIPGVRGIEFGAGFGAAKLRGSENNDAFALREGRVCTVTNHHGGLLGGMTSGMPLLLRLAMKPTPSIFVEQRSVDLRQMQEIPFSVKGRHDPCIALRAVPVAEALCALTLADELLRDEAAHPRICLTLSAGTIAENLRILDRARLFVDMVELRADALEPGELAGLAQFPARAGVPAILTVRRVCDGGFRAMDESRRKEIFLAAFKAERGYAAVDFEADFHDVELESAARAAGCEIIRSLHDFSGPVENLRERLVELSGEGREIAKIACMVNSADELAEIFRQCAEPLPCRHIVCAMGHVGMPSRILAQRTGSFLTFVSPADAAPSMKSLGHLSPEELVRTYRFRTLEKSTELFGVTGWPLEHTSSPEINNAAFSAEGLDAVLLPLPAKTAAEAMRLAKCLRLRAMAVTVPHKESIMELLDEIDASAATLGAVNTVLREDGRWKGYNTDWIGFTEAIKTFAGVETLEGRRVALIGAGGAAKAVAFALRRLGAETCVFNRTLSRAKALAEEYGFAYAPLDESGKAQLQNYSDLIVQTTSVGLGDEGGDPIAFHEFTGKEMVYDLIYAPAETPLLRRAKAAGCRVENGFSMLLAQAAAQRKIYGESGGA